MKKTISVAIFTLLATALSLPVIADSYEKGSYEREQYPRSDDRDEKYEHASRYEKEYEADERHSYREKYHRS